MPDGEPFCTDSGNRILDCNVGSIADPAMLEEKIGRIVGVVECGLFVGLADMVFIGDATGVTCLERIPRPSVGA
jgi:ribose 5-phosphate isomerase A